MKISTKGRYGIRLIADLAMNSCGEAISLKEISARQNISVKVKLFILTLCQYNV